MAIIVTSNLITKVTRLQTVSVINARCWVNLRTSFALVFSLTNVRLYQNADSILMQMFNLIGEKSTEWCGLTSLLSLSLSGGTNTELCLLFAQRPLLLLVLLLVLNQETVLASRSGRVFVERIREDAAAAM